MPVWPEKLQFQTIDLLLVTVRKELYCPMGWDNLCWATKFHPYTSNIRLRKDNALTRVFMTKLEKDK